MKKEFKNLLDEQFKTAKDYKPKIEWYEGTWSRYKPEKGKDKRGKSGVDLNKLIKISEKINKIPAKMDVPSIPAYPYIIISSPMLAFEVVKALEASISPNIVPQIIGWDKPNVISVWPPTIVTLISLAARFNFLKISRIFFSVIPIGNKIVARNHLGIAPEVTISFALTCNEYHSKLSLTNVIGSVFTIKVLLPKEIWAVSSPIPGPCNTLLSLSKVLILEKMVTVQILVF